MSSKKYNKEDLFTQFMGKTEAKTEEKKVDKRTIPTKKQPVKSRKSKPIQETEDVIPRPVGRPASIDEEVKKYSYYLTERHYKALKLCAIKLDTDFSDIVRNALEEYCRKNGTW